MIFAERDVDAPGHEVGLALVEHEFDRDFGMTRPERRDQRRDDLPAEAERCADADEPTRRSLAQIAHLFERLQYPLDAGPTVVEEELAFTRQRSRARRPLEEPRAELPFELLHAPADGRAPDAEPLARARKAAFRRDGYEGDHAGVACREARSQRVVIFVRNL